MKKNRQDQRGDTMKLTEEDQHEKEQAGPEGRHRHLKYGTWIRQESQTRS